MSTTS